MQNRNQFNQLFQFIQKNKFIPEFLAEIKSDDEKVIKLKLAISKGDSNAEIFQNPNCYLYLLYLIKHEHISFEQGMTTYAYLIALMQYTSKQPLRECDADLRTPGKVRIFSLVENTKITSDGEKYLKETCERFARIGYTISYEKLVNHILNLPPVEQWMLEVENHSIDVGNMLFKISYNIPFVSYAKTEIMSCTVPSTSIIHFLLQQMSHNPLKMQFEFGAVNIETLYKLHEQSLHPVILYAPHVKSYPKEVHDFRCGPFPTWLHDIGHTFWGSMLLPEERQLVLEDFIPLLKKLKHQAELKDNPTHATHIQNLIDRIGEFDLTRIEYYERPKIRLYKYLLRGINYLENLIQAKIPELSDENLKPLFQKLKTKKLENSKAWSQQAIDVGIKAIISKAQEVEVKISNNAEPLLDKELLLNA